MIPHGLAALRMRPLAWIICLLEGCRSILMFPAITGLLSKPLAPGMWRAGSKEAGGDLLPASLFLS